MEKYKIREDWEDYYLYLEDLRCLGVINMYGATPYLQAEFGLTEEFARKILINWMHNYAELCNKYKWRELDD